ncbi:MAG: FAD:protein FMN transferase [Desulfosoma sp.]
MKRGKVVEKLMGTKACIEDGGQLETVMESSCFSKPKRIRGMCIAILVGFFWVCLGACGQGPEVFQTTKPLMGTVVTISVVSQDARRAYEALETAFDEIARLEAMMSVFREESEVSRVNREASQHPVPVSEELFQVIEMSLSLSEITHGAFDITVGPLMTLWPFYKKDKILPSPHALQEALSNVGYRRLVVSPRERSVFFSTAGMALDLGGIAKGFAIDRAVAVLKDHGMAAALVNAGGDIFAYGTKPDGQPWRIGLQHPRDPQTLLAVLSLTDRAVVTSGDYQRYFLKDGKRYSHIVDPRNGFTAQETASVTVIADRAAYADALATGILVLGVKEGMALVESLPGVHALIVKEGENRGLDLYVSRGFPQTLDEAFLASQGVKLIPVDR